MQIALCSETPERSKELEALACRWQLSHHPDAVFQLTLTAERLELRKLDEPKLGAIYVDWVSGASAHRRKFGGGKGQSIAKAVGLNKGVTPTVLDATAGLGRDGFVLASLGCKVILVERHPVVAALLDDGIARAKQDPEIGAWVSERVHLVYGSSHQGLATRLAEQQLPVPDVVYLDPMFPHKKKVALVKKEMRVFQSLVGADLDADELWQPCYELASKRLVVKRPSYADFLANQQPSSQICTKNNRFDLYVKAAMK